MMLLIQYAWPFANVLLSYCNSHSEFLSSVAVSRSDAKCRDYSSQGGFSLLEMIAVVAIIGVLAAVAIPRYQQYVARSQISSAYMVLKGQQVGVEDLLLRGATPSLELLGHGGEEVTHAHGKWKIGGEGSLRYTFGEGASPLLAKGSWIELKPGNNVQGWICSVDAALSKELVPSGCTANSSN